jgi:hypothetical protein
MPVSFAQIEVGSSYSRNELAAMWGYADYQALARGVVTPRDENKVILFVTEEKQASAEQYHDRLDGDKLDWEGPNDHFAEERILAASRAGHEIHVFHRERHHTNFTYCGEFTVVDCQRFVDRPSKFSFKKK